MAGSFDATLKQLLDVCAPDWVKWLAPLVGLPATVSADPLDADLSTVQPTADKVFQLRPPATGLLHLEPQSSWDGSFPNRLLLYNVLLENRYGGPVHSVALLLRREANSSALTGTLTRQFADGREYLRFGYAIIRVWELSADVLLVDGLGATPLALLTDDAEPRLPAIVSRFADRVNREVGTAEAANLLLSCGFILLGLRYDKKVAESLFRGVQKMRESSTYQAILDEGRAEERVARQEDLIAVLREKFGTVPPEIEAKIRTTTDTDKLRNAFRQVLHIATPTDLPL
jgi:hypothetical protein